MGVSSIFTLVVDIARETYHIWKSKDGAQLCKEEEQQVKIKLKLKVINFIWNKLKWKNLTVPQFKI